MVIYTQMSLFFLFRHRFESCLRQEAIADYFGDQQCPKKHIEIKEIHPYIKVLVLFSVHSTLVCVKRR